jgi:cytochrome c
MHFIRFIAFAFAAFSTSHAALAQTQAGIELARENKCLACHQIDSRRVGPPFAAVAQRFAGQPQAQGYLANVIQHGGRGQWGAIPMPAQTHVSPAQAAALADWILSLANAPRQSAD